jgi:hypothetical protein
MQIVALEKQLVNFRNDHPYRLTRAQEHPQIFASKTMETFMGERLHNPKTNQNFFPPTSPSDENKPATPKETNLAELDKIISKSKEDLVDTLRGINILTSSMDNNFQESYSSH